MGDSIDRVPLLSLEPFFIHFFQKLNRNRNSRFRSNDGINSANRAKSCPFILVVVHYPIIDFLRAENSAAEEASAGFRGKKIILVVYRGSLSFIKDIRS